MAMTFNAAGQHQLARGIDFVRTGAQVFTQRHDAAIFYRYIGGKGIGRRGHGAIAD